MKPIVKRIRDVLKAHRKVQVRAWRSGEIWVSSPYRSATPDIVRDLEAAGYVCVMEGKPGTAGANIITVR